VGAPARPDRPRVFTRICNTTRRLHYRPVGVVGPTVVLTSLVAGVFVFPTVLSKVEMATLMPEFGGSSVYIVALESLAGASLIVPFVFVVGRRVARRDSRNSDVVAAPGSYRSDSETLF
jgi:hypothetical protein